MAESVLKEIIEEVVQKTENYSKEEKKSAASEVALKCVDTIAKHLMTLRKEELKEVVRKETKDLNEMECAYTETDKEIESESEPSDEILSDENNNDMLTTEDEAEDFLKHVLRDTSDSDSDQDAEKGSKGFELSAEGFESMGGPLNENETSLSVASAFGSIVDTPVMTESEKMLKQTSHSELGLKVNSMKSPVMQESDSALSNTSNSFPITSVISVSNVDKDANTLSSSDISLQQTKPSTEEKPSDADINNNYSDNSSSSNLFDASCVFKYDWAKCYNPYVTDNRDLSTPDAEMENISPELSCLMQLSPTATYGKDHAIGCQRLYSRQHPQTVRSGSTLNTPDPIFYEDTDSNESNMAMFRKYNAAVTENPVPAWPDLDVNNDLDANDAIKGTKRKHSDVDHPDEIGTSPNILPDSVVTSIMNQGRPPDISTWRAVNSSCDTQGNFMNDDIDGHWSKPTCTVQPFQNNGLFSDSLVNGFNSFGTNQQQAMYTASVYNPYEHANNLSVSQQPYNQFNSVSTLLRSSCQFTTNQARNPTNYASQLYNNSLPNSAAYRLDFSSPVNVGSPGVLNFVSHPPYLGVDLTRPLAVHANSLPNTDYNTSLRYSSVPNRHGLNVDDFRSFYQPHSQGFQQVSFRNPYLNQLNQNPPSATQTFVESQAINSQGTTLDSMVNVSDENKEINQVTTSGTRDFNNNTNSNVGESGVMEEDQTSIVGCKECDLITDSSSKNERKEAEKSSDISNNVLGNLNMKSSSEEPPDKDTSSTDDSSASHLKTQDKGVQSNEADSTTIDLTGDSVEDKEGFDNETGGIGSPTPAHIYPKIQNKYFTEIYMRKSRTSSPITSFCTALDLSKREEKKDMKKAARPTVPQKILPYGEPDIPISAILNSVQAPTLAYSGAMLVPYMNSIFAAMANLNKTQTTSTYSSVSTLANAAVGTKMAETVQNTPSVSPLTQTNNLTLNQQVLMYSNFLQASRSAVSTSTTTETTSNPQNTGNGQTVSVPTVNVNSIPLPLYAAPIQYPIRPLVPVVNQIGNTQGLVNPYMCRFNLGVVCHFRQLQVCQFRQLQV
ncbi:uncharacterized protein LOC128559895 [Mercenaria mercenaria]|uniref:uncharacterized protein LOC128559895 n=1 Tax=Mercenaria mercenaria TaxID=6596 RepID=UPI00234FA217|nr:uncharacterized protein LOC128559895 [Mercenaria mercenaria]